MTEEFDLEAVLEDVSPMFWKNGRLNTFKHWPFKTEEDRCNPHNMASAGFFAVGGKDEPDLVECFICSKQLDGWEPEDDPWEEHKKHQPNCCFIKLNKQNEGSMTIKELFSLIQNYNEGKTNQLIERTAEAVKKEWKESINIIPDLCQGKAQSKRASSSYK